LFCKNQNNQFSFQKLNADLSKKVQEIKIANNATNNELIRTRNELMAEQLKCSELRRAINVMNQQCSDFFNAYMLNLRKCIEKTDLGITMPAQMNDTQDAAGCSSSSTGQGAIIFRPMRMHQPNETNLNLPNILNTIVEESTVDAQFHLNDPIVASTPFISTVLRDSQNIIQLPRAFFPEKESETIEMVAPTPKRSSLPKLLSQGVRLSKQRISEDTSSEEETTLPEQEKTYVTARNNTRRENIAVNLSQDDDDSIQDLNQEETIAEVSQAELSISEYPLKELTVNVTKIQATTSSLSTYTKSFILPQPQVLPVPNKIVLEDKQDEIKENIRAASIESSTSSSMSNFSISTVASSTSQVSKASRKRKAVSEIPRRSTGRPKRKARPVFASLVEKPLNRKLRRSK
jgi:hypothetical protein